MNDLVVKAVNNDGVVVEAMIRLSVSDGVLRISPRSPSSVYEVMSSGINVVALPSAGGKEAARWSRPRNIRTRSLGLSPAALHIAHCCSYPTCPALLVPLKLPSFCLSNLPNRAAQR